MTKKSSPVVEAAYIPLARRVLQLSQTLSKGKDELIRAKKQCATALHAVGNSSFLFSANGKDFEVRLERPCAKRINVRKLYTMLANHEITLDDFLDCVVADVNTVQEIIGESRTVHLLEDYKKGLDLIIEPV